jgi:glycosyltransferase involved in cell wall biosynthesis
MYFIDWFLLDQIQALSLKYDVTVCVQCEDDQYFSKKGIKARLIPIEIVRKVSPLRDLVAIFALVREFRRNDYALVHSTGPKGGLLAMIASALCRVPCRVHTFTGQVWSERKGVARAVFKCFDWIVARLSTFVLVDSKSQRQFLLDEGVVEPGTSRVLANGSISGVDMERFLPNPTARMELRESCGLQATDLVFLYMARLTRDKGALLMADGFAEFCRTSSECAHLLVVGPDEEGLVPQIRAKCEPYDGRVHVLGFTKVPEKMIAACDVLCLPSYREGFGTVLIDAAAAGVPAIAARIYGSVDAVEEGVTGMLHHAGDIDDLVRCMQVLARNPALRRQFGLQARDRAQRLFSQEAVTAAVVAFYEQILNSRPATV